MVRGWEFVEANFNLLHTYINTYKHTLHTDMRVVRGPDSSLIRLHTYVHTDMRVVRGQAVLAEAILIRLNTYIHTYRYEGG